MKSDQKLKSEELRQFYEYIETCDEYNNFSDVKEVLEASHEIFLSHKVITRKHLWTCVLFSFLVGVSLTFMIMAFILF